MTISAKNTSRPVATILSHEFIDNYMARANGEYVKVYLYVLRHAGENITDEDIAENLELTIGDVSRALAYWKRLGLLDTSSEKENEETEDSSSKLQSRLDDEEFKEMNYALQKYLSAVFGPKEYGSIMYMYDVLGMSRELIEYLVEICVGKGKTSMDYIEAIARDWHEKGITTIEEAKEDTRIYASETLAVMKAFGINDRNPGKVEKQYIDKWFRRMGFTPEVVLNACERTLSATAKPSFPYVDSILTKWDKAGVKSLEDVDKLDKMHEENVKALKENAALTKATGTYGKLVSPNFEQRNDDLDSKLFDRLSEKLN